MDRLEQIMEKQRELQLRLGTDFSNMTLEERAAFMRDHRGYLADEVAEALYEMPCYKLWKDYSKMSEGDVHVAWQKVRMELVDSLHFFVNLLLCAGFTAEELHAMYMAKNKENHRRQDEGYDTDCSYRDQAVEDVLDNYYECTVKASGTTTTSEDFIAVIRDSDGAIGLTYNTDIAMLSAARNMLDECIDIEMKKAEEAMKHE